MVDAPWVELPRTLLKAARTMPLGSIPLSVQKVRFSAATTASCIVCGICSSGIDSRFWVANLPSSLLPSA
jgi:hypothetical protein